MADAAFTVAFAGPLVTLQDAGRPGHMRYGVPASGPMDRLAFDAAQAALGNQDRAAALEISLGGLILQCTQGAVTLAVTGGEFSLQHAAKKLRGWTILTLRKGERLAITAGPSGSWAYLAFAGTMSGAAWLGSRATHSTSGFGGAAIQTGQTITLRDVAIREDREGDIPRPDLPAPGAIRVVTGPQDQYFAAPTVERFVTDRYLVSEAYDRMGMRLKGPKLPLAGALSIPSEPIVRGSVQVSGDGVPTVLMADHQTTGGYPKIATLLSADTDRLAQYRAGQPVRFAAITSAQAIQEARQAAAQRAAYLAQISKPRGTLLQRLMRENLNHGCIYD